MSLVPLADVKAHLGITKPDDDTKLQGKLDAAEALVSKILGGSGGLAASTITQRANGFRSSLTLTTFPVLSVTSVTGSDGVQIPLGGLDIDLSAGIIRSNATYYYASPWYPFLLPFYTIVYQSGYASPPADIGEAVMLMTQHLWETQRGNLPGPGGDTGPTESYARAMQMLGKRTIAGFS